MATPVSRLKGELLERRPEIKHEWFQTEMSTSLAPQLDGIQHEVILERALEAALKIDDKVERAEMLVSFFEAMPDHPL